MYYKLNKKGVSEVVQVLIITVLSIVAISIVSSYVISISNNVGNQLSPAVDCLTVKTKIDSACIGSDGQVRALVNIGLDEHPSIKFSIENKIFQCSSSSDECSSCKLNQGKQEIYLPIQTTQATDLIYQVNNCASQNIQLKVCAGP